MLNEREEFLSYILFRNMLQMAKMIPLFLVSLQWILF